MKGLQFMILFGSDPKALIDEILFIFLLIILELSEFSVVNNSVNIWWSCFQFWQK